jgi:hypothetical protein
MTSKEKLASLRYDPIENMILNHDRILAQLEYYDQWREGTLVPLDANGKPRYYNAEVHMNLYDKLNKIAESLLRYNYGRVSEAENNERISAPIVINLTTKEPVELV